MLSQGPGPIGCNSYAVLLPEIGPPVKNLRDSPQIITTDVVELASRLKSTRLIRTRDYVESSGSVLGNHRHDWFKVEEGIILHTANFTAKRSVKFRERRSNQLCFEIPLVTGYSKRLDELEDCQPTGAISISNTASAEFTFKAGSNARGVSIYCDRRRFLSTFKIDTNRIQERSRAIFLSNSGAFDALRIPLFSSTMINVDQILSCTFAEPLRSIYLSSKTMEILCTLVAQIHEFGAGPRLFSPRGLRVHSIEAAAEIYRRELRSPPTVEQVAERVGMDRRELTKGFQEVFGVTPHRYQLQQRMDHAESLLREGGRSISEIGRLVGYQGYRTFARAYAGYFDRPPTVHAR